MKRQQRQPANQRRRGAALVEMAFVLPVFMMVTLGIIEFGRAMMVGQLITNAAREGARLGIIDGNTNAEVIASIQSFLQQSANIPAADLTIDITVTPEQGNPDPGNEVSNALPKDLVSVYVSVPFDKVSYISGNYLNGKTLSGRSSMRHE